MENEGDLYAETLSFDSTLEGLFDVDSLFVNENSYLQPPSGVTMAAQSDSSIGIGVAETDVAIMEEVVEEVAVSSGSSDYEHPTFNLKDTDECDVGLTIEMNGSISNNHSVEVASKQEALIDVKQETDKIENISTDKEIPLHKKRSSKSDKIKTNKCPVMSSSASSADRKLPNVDFEKLKEMRRKKLAVKAPRPPSVKTQPEFLEQKKIQLQKAKDSMKRKSEEQNSCPVPPAKVPKSENKEVSIKSDACEAETKTKVKHNLKVVERKSDLTKNEDKTSKDSRRPDVSKVDTNEIKLQPAGPSQSSVAIPETEKEYTFKEMDQMDVVDETRSDADSLDAGNSTDMDDIEMSEMKVLDEDDEEDDLYIFENIASNEVVDEASIEEIETEYGYSISDIKNFVNHKTLIGVKSDDEQTNENLETKDDNSNQTGNVMTSNVMSENVKSKVDLANVESENMMNKGLTKSTVNVGKDPGESKVVGGVDQETDNDSEMEMKDDEVYAMLEAGMTNEDVKKAQAQDEYITKLLLEGNSIQFKNVI